MRSLLFSIAMGVSFLSLSHAQADEVTWDGQISAIMSAKCTKCHGGLIPQGGLKLNNLRNALRGGNTGAVVIPGDADGSIMVQQFSLPATDPKRMPPAAEPAQLTAAEIAAIRAWIDSGAE